MPGKGQGGSSQPPLGERCCIRHRDRSAIGLCYLCHKPLCAECRYAAPVQGIFCSQECYDKYVAYQGRKRPELKPSGLKRLLVRLAILVAIAAGAVFIGGSLGLPVLKPIRDAILSRGR